MPKHEQWQGNITQVTSTHKNSVNDIVQALASQGDEIALEYALVSTYPANLLIVSPLLRGSNPYPCGSLTYRNYIQITYKG